MIIQDEIMKLATELYYSPVKFMITINKDLGGVSPLTCVVSGEADKVLEYLKAQKDKKN